MPIAPQLHRRTDVSHAASSRGESALVLSLRSAQQGWGMRALSIVRWRASRLPPSLVAAWCQHLFVLYPNAIDRRCV